MDEAELAAIRARVLERIREAPQRGWSWRMAYAMAAVVMVVAGVVWFNRPENAPPELPRPVIAVAPTPVVVAQAAPVAKRRRPARPKPVLKEERPAEPLLVKLETSDPDVIIYWIVESKGG
jgi:negative regulator of sigma E activity